MAMLTFFNIPMAIKFAILKKKKGPDSWCLFNDHAM